MGTAPVIVPHALANENPEVDTHSQQSNSELEDCESDALPYDYGHHNESSRKFSNRVENTVGKGEIAIYEHLASKPGRGGSRAQNQGWGWGKD